MNTILSAVLSTETITSVFQPGHLVPRALAWLTANAVAVLFVSVISTVGVEALIRRRSGRSVQSEGSLTSISAGIAYIAAKGIVSKGAMFGISMWLYNNHRLLDLDPFNPLVWLALFVARDFIYYWIHRAEHRVNLLWASHMIHHSSTHFNFTTAVRMPWMEAMYKPMLGLWVPLLGFHPAVMAGMGALVLLVGQFQHTELYRRSTVLDLAFVTPSAHRVHHGSNAVYLDKNFGSMLIVWDRLFGTFQAETERVVYGLTGNKQISSPKAALTGGYPALAERMRSLAPRQTVGLLMARP